MTMYANNQDWDNKERNKKLALIFPSCPHLLAFVTGISKNKWTSSQWKNEGLEPKKEAWGEKGRKIVNPDHQRVQIC